MIDNINTNNFYNKKEMKQRTNYIPVLKEETLKKLKDLTEKVKNEEPMPHGNMTIETLGDINDEIDNLLSKWYY